MQVPEFSPSLGFQETAKVLETLAGNWITEGPKTRELEEALAKYVGCRRVLMVPNGTQAIFAALKVLGIGPGDEVMVPDFTFFGTVSAVLLTGATPVLVDVDEFDGNICIPSAERSLSAKTKAIVPVHIYGQSCDMTAVRALADRHALRIVEDAAQGMGVTFEERHVGTLGDIGCISFFADKTMTTGEGGALLVDDARLVDECVYFKNQGRLTRGTFVHERIGYNFRITDMQAAVGLAQFSRIESTIERKLEIQRAYVERLAACPGLRFLGDNGFGRNVPFRVNILVDDPEGLQAHLKMFNIGTRRFFYPLHMQPALANADVVVRERPISSIRLFERGLMLPTGFDLSEEQIDYVCDAIRAFQAGRMVGTAAVAAAAQ